MLLAPDLREWLPADHIVHFIIESVEGLDLRGFRVNERGSGSAQYPPAMMLALLIYSYATGRFSSREIQAATYHDVAVRYICGGEHHPEHDTICVFRRANRQLFEECFLKVLLMARGMKHLKAVGAISVDGSKILANASKHSAVSYERAGELIRGYQQEIKALTDKAEQIDNTPLADGYHLPEEIARRADRVKALEEARRFMEAAYETQRQQLQAEYEAKLAEQEKKRAEGKNCRGRPPQAPSQTPPGNAQHNFTDPESRIMKAGNGKHFEQAYNAQAAVDAEGSQLILGARVTATPNDKEQLPATVASVDPSVRQASAVLADSGFYSEAAVRDVEADQATTVYAAMDRQSHHRSVADLEAKAPPAPPPAGAAMGEIMRYRLKTPAGQRLYRLRKQTVEPVFGIIKQAMGFRRFSLRGLANVSTEWVLVCLSYNLKRLFNLKKQVDSPETSPSGTCSEQILPPSAHPSLLKQPVATLLRFFGHFIPIPGDHYRIALSPTGC
jgi:transposase/peptidoglycan hydrolase-like protein with peptidoglycan-binding domain